MNRWSFYHVDIFQCAYDTICITLENGVYTRPAMIQFDIPVREKPGTVIQINKASISTDTGKAEDLIEFLDSENGKEFIPYIIQKLVFDHPFKSKMPGL
jgi:hypothetical protein